MIRVKLIPRACCEGAGIVSLCEVDYCGKCRTPLKLLNPIEDYEIELWEVVLPEVMRMHTPEMANVALDQLRMVREIKRLRALVKEEDRIPKYDGPGHDAEVIEKVPR